jgi:hypothetical protein
MKKLILLALAILGVSVAASLIAADERGGEWL